MENSGVKLWIAAFVFTTMASSGIALYQADQKTYYKGLETLTALKEATPAPSGKVARLSKQKSSEFASVLQSNKERINGFLDSGEFGGASVLEATESPKEEKAQVARCAADDTPVISNGLFVGCKSNIEAAEKEAAALVETTLPVKTVSVIEEAKQVTQVIIEKKVEEPSSISFNKLKRQTTEPSCNEQEKFVYSGPDMPGLLYGMCIECDTVTFVNNNYSCQE